jgi:hypothetical protein
MFPKGAKERRNDAKNRKKCGHFHGRKRREETRKWALRRRRTMREKKEEEKEELSSR